MAPQPPSCEGVLLCALCWAPGGHCPKSSESWSPSLPTALLPLVTSPGSFPDPLPSAAAERLTQEGHWLLVMWDPSTREG